MSAIIKNESEIKTLREGGKRLATILKSVAGLVRPGISTDELDVAAHKMITDSGDIPAFLGYQPDLHDAPYPASLCTSINDEIVHGIPKKDRILKEGDIVSLDLGLKHGGLFTDHAVTVAVGKISNELQELLAATEEALRIGIEAARPGNTIGDIGHAIESYIKPYKFGIVRELSGHGVGREIHEDPYIPNFGKSGTGEVLKAGMVIAIEPIINLGKPAMYVGQDGYTCKTKDGLASAHFEHTVLITEDAPEILTQI